MKRWWTGEEMGLCPRAQGGGGVPSEPWSEACTADGVTVSLL